VSVTRVTSHFVRSRRFLVVPAVMAVLAGCAYVATPYARATSLIVRGAHLGGAIETFANGRSYAVDARPAHTVPTRHGEVPARFYVPAKVIGHPVIVIPGIHSAGIEEGRLTALSGELAATGLTVMTIALPDLQAYRITPAATDTIEDAVSWLAGQREYARAGRKNQEPGERGAAKGGIGRSHRMQGVNVVMVLHRLVQRASSRVRRHPG